MRCAAHQLDGFDDLNLAVVAAPVAAEGVFVVLHHSGAPAASHTRIGDVFILCRYRVKGSDGRAGVFVGIIAITIMGDCSRDGPPGRHGCRSLA